MPDANGVATAATNSGGGVLGKAYLAALGGPSNLTQIAACTTRLRLQVRDQAAVDEAGLRAIGAKGLMQLSDRDLQVVIGPEADLIAGEMREAAGPLAAAETALSAATPKAGAEKAIDPATWMTALGGKSNVREMGSANSRLWVSLNDSGKLDSQALTRLGVRMVTAAGQDMHLLAPEADEVAEVLGRN